MENLLLSICDFWVWKRLWRASIEMEFMIPSYGIKLLETVQYYFYFDCSSHKPKMLSQIIWIYLWFCLPTDLQWLFICSHCSSGQMNVVFDYSVCPHVLIYMIRSQSSPFPVYYRCAIFKLSPQLLASHEAPLGTSMCTSCFDAPSMPLEWQRVPLHANKSCVIKIKRTYLMIKPALLGHVHFYTSVSQFLCKWV